MKGKIGNATNVTCRNMKGEIRKSINLYAEIGNEK